MKSNVEPKFTIHLMFWRLPQSVIELIETCRYAEAESYDEEVNVIPAKRQTGEGPLKDGKDPPTIGQDVEKVRAKTTHVVVETRHVRHVAHCQLII